jgi:hypothetical protein
MWAFCYRRCIPKELGGSKKHNLFQKQMKWTHILKMKKGGLQCKNLQTTFFLNH